MKNLLNQTIEAVKAAGRIFNETIKDDSIIVKGTANYVTHVDFKVQEFLIDKLSTILPESNIITEESDSNSFNLDRPTWILDPVDGTTNLMYGFNLSAISLALFCDKKPAIGIVFNPVCNELFTAETGSGAFLNGIRINTSPNPTLDKCLIGFGTSPYDKSRAEKVFCLTQKIYSTCRDVRRTGSAALDIAYVACGRLDAYYEMNLQPWDYAAGLLILSEAGGKITDWKGIQPNVLFPSDILASNGIVHELILNEIRA